MSSPTGVIEQATPTVSPKPSEQRRMEALAASLLKKSSDVAAKFTQTRGVLLGGSFAKGTWLPGHVDLDIFVRFDPATPERDFEKIGLAIGTGATIGFPRGKKYAQHPYTEAIVRGVRVNIVPCYAVQDQDWKSAADRSPFHVDLVKGLPEEKKTQIKLLKRFMKAAGVYGAEIETQGFSGYVAEVLVIKQGSLEKVLRWFSAFKPSNEERMFSLRDPIDEGRDLGIAVSKEKLGRMVLAAREFLRRPMLAFFSKLPAKTRPSMDESIYVLAFTHSKLSEDTLWGELRRTSKHMVRHLEVQGFKVARWMAASNNRDHSAILIIPEFSSLPRDEQRIGPTVDRAKDVSAFISTNRRSSKLVWVDDDARVRLLKPRTYTKVSDLIRDIAKGRAGKIGASMELEKGMKKSALVLTGSSLSRAASKSQWLRNGIKEISTDAIGTSST